MKKIISFVFLATIATVITTAQDCVQFFPSSEGTVLTTKTYNANNRLLNTMIYRVNSVSNNVATNSMEIGFTLMDGNDNAVSTATIDASCMDGNFRMKMVSRGYSPDVVRAMTTNTELIGYFLNYPNIFNDNSLINNSPFSMDGGEYTIEDNSDKRENVRVRVFNRQLEGREDVFTPARRDSFSAYKISFSFDVITGGETVTLRGIQWYSPNYGIVRSETLDGNGNLINKTELSSIHEM